MTASLGLLCLLLLQLLDPGSWSWAGLAVLAAAVVATELRPVHVARHGQRHSFTLTEGVLVAALAIGPGRSVVLAVAVGVLAAQVLRRLPHYKVAFNVAQFAAATAAASVVAEHVPGSLGVVAAIVVFTVLNDSVVCLVIGLTTGCRPRRPMQDANVVWLLHVSAVCSIALLGAHVYMLDPMSLPAFVAPALLVLWSQEQANRRRTHTTVVDALAEQATTLYGRSSAETAVLLARTAREVLAAARTELVLLGDDSLLVFSAGPDGVEHSRLDHSELISGWRGRVFEGTRAAADGTWAGVVVGREVPRALLAVWRDEQQEAFRRGDVSLLQILADTVAPSLSVDDREDDGLLAVRRQAVEGLGSDGREIADALGMLGALRQRVQSPAGPGDATALAADLRDVEQRIAAFVGDLMVIDLDAQVDERVAMGKWSRTS